VNLLAALKFFNQDGEDWVSLILNATVDNTNCNIATSDNVIIPGFHVLVNLRETFIYVPEKDHTQACSSCLHATLFVLVNPVFLLVASLSHQQIFAISSIYESIYIGHCKILLRAINVLGHVVLPLL